MANFLNDTFTEAADTNLTAHTPEIGSAWAKVTGQTPDAIVRAATGQLDNNNGVSTARYYNSTAPAGTDYSVEGSFTRNDTATGSHIICARHRTDQITGYILVVDPANANVVLRRYNNGTLNTLATRAFGTWTTGTSKTFKMTVEGVGATVTINVTQDGTPVVGMDPFLDTADAAPGNIRIVDTNRIAVHVPTSTAGVGTRISSIRGDDVGATQSQAPRSISQNRFMRG